MPDAALGSQEPHMMKGGEAGRLPSRKGPWGTGQQLGKHEPAGSSGGQEGQWNPSLYQQ